MLKEIFTRNELYDLVWSEPIATIAKKYNISDVGLRKICLNLNIPLPDNGYWPKVKWGKEVKKKPLLANNTDNPPINLTIRENFESHPNPVKELAKKISFDKTISYKVPTKLTRPDPLILTTKEALLKSESFHHNVLVLNFSEGLSISVSRSIVNRALLFFDTLIKILKQRGHDVKINDHGTFAIIDDTEMRIKVREKLRREQVKVGIYSMLESIYHPTGILAFAHDVFEGKEWVDGKVKIENRLPEIIAYLELKAKELQIEKIKLEKQWELQREELRIQNEFKARKEYELKEFKKALRLSDRYDHAIKLKNYINQFEAVHKSNGTLTPESQEWITWAKKKADWYDPFTEGEDEFFKDVNRDELKS